MRKKVFSLFGLVIAIGLLLNAAMNIAASSPNYGDTQEHLEYVFEGYVQCQPSYNENGYHAARGSFRYINGAEGEKWWYTEYGKHIEDANIYSVTGYYRDSLSLDAPPVEFYTQFDWIAHGSDIWPISIEVVNN